MTLKSCYQLSEQDLVRISSLLSHLEEAIKEMIRTRPANDDVPGPAELTFYEETSRIFMDQDFEIFPF